MAEQCGGGMASINHGVVAIGWGTEDGTDYWLLRNSWGGRWGLNGHIKIERSKSDASKNACGILEINSFPQF